MIQVKEMSVDELRPWDANPRINDHAVDAVARSIKTFGFNSPILCDQNHMIIAGHTRWKAAKKLGLKNVPVIEIEMNDSQRKAFSIADNKTAEIADWDIPQLKELFDQLQAVDIDFGNLGFSGTDLHKYFYNDSDSLDDGQSNTREKRVKRGDIWILGHHRLHCENSEKVQNILKLLDGEQVDFVFADPPYFNLREYSHWTTFKDYLDCMRKIMLNCNNSMKDGSVIVWKITNLCSEKHDLISHHSLIHEGVGFNYLETIIWKKTGANYSICRNAHIKKNRIYYPTYAWEVLLVYKKPGRMPKMTCDGANYMANYQSNLWEVTPVRNKMKSYGHPDVCPVELPYRSIQAYTGREANVFDPFGGSGTTLIAAEKSGRKAFVMEQNPEYCDIIIHRWESMTGEKAEKLFSN